MGSQSLRGHNCSDDVIEKYADMVYRLAFSQTRSKSDADDVFQEVFLRYVKKPGNFESEEHRKAWLIRVTINCCKKLLASQWFKRVVSLKGIRDAGIIDQEPHEITFETHEEIDLHHALKKLPPKYRAVIHLFYYEAMSIAEISYTLGLKPSTVRAQLTGARSMLREFLKGEVLCLKRPIEE